MEGVCIGLMCTWNRTYTFPKTLRRPPRLRRTAAALGWSVRTVAYILPAARHRLADVLDRRDLL